MKKILLFIALVLCLPLFASCSSNKILIEAQYNIKESINIYYDELKEKLSYTDESNNKVQGENFILYVYTSGCTSCSRFENNVLNKYIEKTNAIIYKIDIEDAKELIKTNKKYESNPRIIVYKEGIVYTQYNESSNSNCFGSLEGFENTINKKVAISNMKVIKTIDELDIVIGNNSSVVYYGWSKCSDCVYLNNNELIKINSNSRYKDFYYFEVNDYRKYKGTEQEQIWNNFVSKYQIDIDHFFGKIPMFAYYEEGALKDAVVYLNDDIEEIDNKIKVINSYYEDSKNLVGKIYDNMNDYREAASKYHNKTLYKFINKYLGK